MKATKEPNKAAITIKADPQIKRRAQAVARKSGSTLSSVLNDYMVEIARAGRVQSSERLKPKVEREILEAVEDYKQGKNISGPFETVEELRRFLQSQ